MLIIRNYTAKLCLAVLCVTWATSGTPSAFNSVVPDCVWRGCPDRAATIPFREKNGVGLEFLGHEGEFPFDGQRRHNCQGKLCFSSINFFEELNQFRALHVDSEPTIVDVVNFEVFTGRPVLQGVRSKAAGGRVRQIVRKTFCLWVVLFGRF
jgi:hypothetical protein